MVIKVDEQGQKVITEMCDLIVRSQGLAVVDSIKGVLQSIILEKPEVKEEVKAE